MPLDNDTRGWIMTLISGAACTAGASLICVDLIIRQLPGKKNFKIQDSNAFLSVGLSLSFGVMIFSALYSILPSAKNYFQKGGIAPKPAAFMLIGCFLLGAVVISILSRLLHKYIPHSVVECDHEHGDEEEPKDVDLEDGGSHPHACHTPMEEQRQATSLDRTGDHADGYGTHSEILRRPSFPTQISSKVTQLVTGAKEFCDTNGQCFGYSSPCGQECFRNVQHTRVPRVNSMSAKHPLTRVRTQPIPHERQPLLQNVDETTVFSPITPDFSGPAAMESSMELPPSSNGHSTHPSLHKQTSNKSLTSSTHSVHSHAHSHAHSHHAGHQHHHHVPTNVFLSIGLQTSMAIALHKIPEGFITYATNHANPTLGFSIFLALFIHNITEGFALALPLYLAINSRWRAMFWSALLGGVSQPLGAGVAALWFKIAGRAGGDGAGEPGDVVYGAMFALTGGVMAMVSLQLFGEAMELTHSRGLCFVGAFVGMGILGLSAALTA